MKRRRDPRAGAGAEDFQREAEGAARAVHAVRVGDERERAARLSFPPLREVENSFFQKAFTAA